jgi:hypothetical protein
MVADVVMSEAKMADRGVAAGEVKLGPKRIVVEIAISLIDAVRPILNECKGLLPTVDVGSIVSGSAIGSCGIRSESSYSRSAIVQSASTKQLEIPIGGGAAGLGAFFDEVFVENANGRQVAG